MKKETQNQKKGSVESGDISIKTPSRTSTMSMIQTEENMASYSLNRKTFIAIVILILATLVVIESLFHRSFANSSCKLTTWFQGVRKESIENGFNNKGTRFQSFRSLQSSSQGSGSSWRRTTSKILSSYLTNWIGLFYFIAVIHPPKVRKKGADGQNQDDLFFNPKIQFLRYYFIWSLPYTVAMVAKPLVAQGRPFFSCKEVEAWSCSCSFGMPSSHSCTGVSVYFTLYSIVNLNLPQKKYYLLKAMFALLCALLAVSIALSRIVLGSHTFVQTLIGFFMGVLGVLFLSKEFFEFFAKSSFFKKSGIFQISVLTLYTLAVVGVTLFGYFLNNGGTRMQNYWLDREECPGCLAKLVFKQMDNNTHFLLTGGYLVGSVFNYQFLRKNSTEKDPKKWSIHWVYFLRTITFIGVSGLLGLLYYALTKIGDMNNDGIFRFFALGPLLGLFGFISMYVMPFLWMKIGCDLEDRDYIFEKI